MNYFLFIAIIILTNFCISVYSENAYYIIGIQRKKLDKNFDYENHEIDELVNDRMNDIYDVIQENKESYSLENGEMDQKLDELNSSTLKKRNNKNKRFLFINKIRPNNSFYKRSLNNTEDYNLDDLYEYIPFESQLISHICPISNYYTVVAYLSDEALEAVRTLDNVLYCEKSNTHTIEGTVNNNKKSNNSINKNEIYYNIEEIKKETKWNDVNVQSFNYPSYPNYLSLISQSPSNINHSKTYDENFYYPSSAGQGVDIYFLDSGINVSHDDFDIYKGASYERTVSCDAVIDEIDFRYTSEDEKKKCNFKDVSSTHGTLTASIAGGKIFGVAKKANIHMIANDLTDSAILKSFDYILNNGNKHKTIINMSIGGFVPYSRSLEDKINDLINEGFILIVSAGNEGQNACLSHYSENFHAFTGYNKMISVGAVDTEFKNNEIIMSSYSNFGKCIDIFAPGHVIDISNISTSSDILRDGEGTSFSSPLVAGVAASIISENPETVFNQELMKKTLINMSIKNVIKNLGSSDTPNRLLNNGKKLSYSPDDNAEKCGISSSNKASCSDGCCTKEGICVKYNDKTYNKCLVENGCQNKYGFCISSKESIEECEKEIKENKECQIELPLDIPTDVNSGYYENIDKSLLNKCITFNSDKCMSFYRKLNSNNSLCSVAKNYKSLGYINSLDKERYDYYNEVCTHVLDVTCYNEYKIYTRCKFDDLSKYANEFEIDEEVCETFKSDKCQNFYKNGLKSLSTCYVFKDFQYVLPTDSKVLEAEYEKIKKQCDNNSKSVEKSCQKVLADADECLFEISSKSSESVKIEKCTKYKSEKCQNFYKYSPNCFVDPEDKYLLKIQDYFYDNEGICDDESSFSDKTKKKIYSDCEKELKSEQNKECILPKYNLEMSEKELSKYCKIFNSDKCQKYYYFERDSFVCSYKRINSGMEYLEQVDSFESNIEVYSNVCNLKGEKIYEKCEYEFTKSGYYRCFIKNKSDLNAEELKDFCTGFKSDKCVDLYSDYFLSFFPYCQSYLNDIMGDIEERYNYGNKVCTDYFGKDKKSYIEKCNKEKKEYKECLTIGEASSNKSKLKDQCTIFLKEKCQNYYINEKIYVPNCVIVDDYSFGDVYDEIYMDAGILTNYLYNVDCRSVVAKTTTTTKKTTTTTKKTTTTTKKTTTTTKKTTTTTKKATTTTKKTTTTTKKTTTTTKKPTTTTKKPTTTAKKTTTTTKKPTTVKKASATTKKPTTTTKKSTKKSTTTTKKSTKKSTTTTKKSTKKSTTTTKKSTKKSTTTTKKSTKKATTTTKKATTTTKKSVSKNAIKINATKTTTKKATTKTSKKSTTKTSTKKSTTKTSTKKSTTKTSTKKSTTKTSTKKSTTKTSTKKSTTKTSTKKSTTKTSTKKSTTKTSSKKSTKKTTTTKRQTKK
ncbi:hypothetical protein BCR32DRAFT_327302 [Anaeromyces robustus]|uniref:Uncharacterized protein n=1 Tax=Anaeromyces robustus TaxID=1754192 RepID=A0A1Y1X712_9FUNG|nr:hypothetical protein BCR32DRAFT_327302 [Anaeromyces robustus]|eukprot:ORX81488.1 hypothetical protein BCR32DRAFT_327302 [Anaeromyces robustus]